MSAPSGASAPARRASAAGAVVLLVALLAWPVLAPDGVRATGPLPDCRYADVLTTPRSYPDGPRTLVDTILRVPGGYAPPDLVSTAQAGIKGGGTVRAMVIDDLRAMRDAAAAAGNDIGVESAYRSYASQEEVFASWVKRFGYDRAIEVSARPGHSEHQLGLTIDFRSEPGGSPLADTWDETPAGMWMTTHAWEYGWIMSYPKDSMALTCYDYEPWHFRYVGRDVASLIHASGVTPREYLWANFTTTIVPPPPPAEGPSKAPKPSTGPVPVPSPSPSPSVLSSIPPSPSPGPTVPPGATTTPTSTTLSPTARPTRAPTAGPDIPGTAGTAAGIAAAAVTGIALLLGLVALGACFARRR